MRVYTVVGVRKSLKRIKPAPSAGWLDPENYYHYLFVDGCRGAKAVGRVVGHAEWWVEREITPAVNATAPPYSVGPRINRSAYYNETVRRLMFREDGQRSWVQEESWSATRAALNPVGGIGLYSMLNMVVEG